VTVIPLIHLHKLIKLFLFSYTFQLKKQYCNMNSTCNLRKILHNIHNTKRYLPINTGFSLPSPSTVKALNLEWRMPFFGVRIKRKSLKMKEKYNIISIIYYYLNNFKSNAITTVYFHYSYLPRVLKVTSFILLKG
jgi:hypothetical protein